SSSARDQVIGLLTRTAVGRVGVSAPFAELADTSRALRYARVAMSGKGEGVSVFDDSVLGVAAVTAPEVTADLAAVVLGRLYQLAAEDRDPLFETFRMWSAVGGNVTDTAERLFVHRNTVRHRLRRIEELTGRSTTAPRDVAELCLAFEVDEHFPVAGRQPLS
ncbi:PucR family transcriptional regulator, partial [Streptomyces sp. SID10244]|nr:PucR family transcriptional regulator [Streptomyces sp. SID10244]